MEEVGGGIDRGTGGDGDPHRGAGTLTDRGGGDGDPHTEVGTPMEEVGGGHR